MAYRSSSSGDGCVSLLVMVCVMAIVIWGFKTAITKFVEWNTSPAMMEFRKTYDPEWQKAEAQRELARQMQIQNELKLKELQLREQSK